MRNLTITRRKKFAACLMAVKVYIETKNSAYADMTISGVPCRKLGNLKNGQTAVFQIDENETKIFVIGDSISKNYCNDSYTVPAGSEDVALSGANKFNLMNGNAFLFDGVTNPEILQKRKENSVKGLIVLIVAIIVGAIIGFLFNRN